MKTNVWNTEKNDMIVDKRGISFEQVVLNIQLGNEVDIYDYPNSERYPNQQISVVIIEDYVYLVPFIENDEEIFLKTVIPSRKATKKYLGDKND